MFLVVLVTIGLLFTQINLLASVLIVGTSVIGAYLLKDNKVKKKVVYIALMWAVIVAFYGVMTSIYYIFNACGEYSSSYYVSGYYDFWSGYQTTINLLCGIAVIVFTVFSVLSWFNKFNIPFVDKTAKLIIGEKTEEVKEEETENTTKTIQSETVEQSTDSPVSVEENKDEE